VTVPTNSTITIHKQTVLIHPVLDKYYDSSPTQGRSPRLALEKGQTSVVKEQVPKNMEAKENAPASTVGTQLPQQLAVR
jgi:glutamine amidotransferase